MSESTMRQRVVKALKELHAVPIESHIRAGTPDVNYIEGWAELKWARSWPKRPGTRVRIDHFNISQRRWLRRRWRLGGNVWLLFQVGQEWLLFDGETAAEYVGNVTRGELYDVARVRWTRGLINKELETCLTMNWENWSGSPLVRPFSLSVEEEARASSKRPAVTT